MLVTLFFGKSMLSFSSITLVLFKNWCCWVFYKRSSSVQTLCLSHSRSWSLSLTLLAMLPLTLPFAVSHSHSPRRVETPVLGLSLSLSSWHCNSRSRSFTLTLTLSLSAKNCDATRWSNSKPLDIVKKPKPSPLFPSNWTHAPQGNLNQFVSFFLLLPFFFFLSFTLFDFYGEIFIFFNVL